MAYSHCTGLGQVQGLRATGSNMLYRYLQTGLRQGKDPLFPGMLVHLAGPVPVTLLCHVNKGSFTLCDFFLIATAIYVLLIMG